MLSNAPSSALETKVDALTNRLADLSLMIKKNQSRDEATFGPSMNVSVHIASTQVMGPIDAMRIHIGTRNALVAESLVIRKQAVRLELVRRGEVAAPTLLGRPKLMLPCRRQ